jgi:hypothetical protein
LSYDSYQAGSPSLKGSKAGSAGNPSAGGQQETLAIAFMFPVTGHRALRQRDVIRDRL